MADRFDVIESAVVQLERDVKRISREINKLLLSLSSISVCMNSACYTGDPTPHMMDEREHRSYEDVMKDNVK